MDGQHTIQWMDKLGRDHSEGFRLTTPDEVIAGKRVADYGEGFHDIPHTFREAPMRP